MPWREVAAGWGEGGREWEPAVAPDAPVPAETVSLPYQQGVLGPHLGDLRPDQLVAAQAARDELVVEAGNEAPRLLGPRRTRWASRSSCCTRATIGLAVRGELTTGRACGRISHRSKGGSEMFRARVVVPAISLVCLMLMVGPSADAARPIGSPRGRATSAAYFGE